jgi:hypothetical protein
MGIEPLIADVPFGLKILASIAIFGPPIVFVFFMVRAARKDGEIQREREKGGSSES